MEIHVIRHGGPLVGAERRELSWNIRLVGERNISFPDRTSNLGRH